MTNKLLSVRGIQVITGATFARVHEWMQEHARTVAGSVDGEGPAFLLSEADLTAIGEWHARCERVSAGLSV